MALALAVVIALFCSYVVAMTVVPLVCSKFIKPTGHGVEHESAEVDDPVPESMCGGHGQQNIFARIVLHFNRAFGWLQSPYDAAIKYCLTGPHSSSQGLLLLLYSALRWHRSLEHAYFLRTDPGQFGISVKARTSRRTS